MNRTIRSALFLAGLLVLCFASGNSGAVAATSQRDSCAGSSGGAPTVGDDKVILYSPNTIISANPLRLASDPDGCPLALVSLGNPVLGLAHITHYLPADVVPPAKFGTYIRHYSG